MSDETSRRERIVAMLRDWSDSTERAIEDGDCLDDGGTNADRIAETRALIDEIEQDARPECREGCGDVMGTHDGQWFAVFTEPTALAEGIMVAKTPVFCSVHCADAGRPLKPRKETP